MAHSEIPALRHDNALLNKQAEQLRKMRELLRAENTDNDQFKQKVQCLGTLISRERFRSKESSISERQIRTWRCGDGDTWKWEIQKNSTVQGGGGWGCVVKYEQI